MKLSVVIPCYNAESTIEEQLDALADQHWTEPWEVVVANNRCTDNSIAIVRSYQSKIPNLRIVDASERQGQPFALNIGAEAALGEALAFCDADDVVGEGWLKAIGDALSKHDFVACRVDADKLNKEWNRNSRGNLQAIGLSRYNYPPFFSHAGGGTLGVKKNLHQIIGGFDESFPYLHDTDYCWKLQLSGVKLVFVQDAVHHIRYRETFKAIFKQSVGYAEYNVLLYKKYRHLGMPKINIDTAIDKWLNFLFRLYKIRSKTGMARSIWQFGRQYGRLKGSIKYRIMAL
jgi:glycosyltransferase involved in cell wall biosynthesis